MSSTQGTGAIALPEKVQEAINIAEAKVSVLRDEEIRLGRVKGEAEKEIARLEIRRDTIEGAIPALEGEATSLQSTVGSLTAAVKSAKEELAAIEENRKSAVKEAKAAESLTKLEAAKLSQIVAQAREAQEAVAEAKVALQANVDAFNTRKARTLELLSSI